MQAPARLINLVVYDAEAAYWLLSGLLGSAVLFVAGTLPRCLSLLGVDGALDHACEPDLVAAAHWGLLSGFVALQLLQLPFHCRSIVYLLMLRQKVLARAGRQELTQLCEAALDGRTWRVHQCIGMVGQFAVPLLGLALYLVAGNGAPCRLLPGDASAERPADAWPFVAWCMAGRIVLNFVWGYYVLHGDNLGIRAASETQLTALEHFGYASELILHLTDCRICLEDFQEGEVLVRLPCDEKHVFHGTCVKDWLRREKTCPLCTRLIDEPARSKRA